MYNGCSQGIPTLLLFHSGFVRDQGFVRDRDYFINRDHAHDRDVLFGRGEVRHEGIISNILSLCA